MHTVMRIFKIWVRLIVVIGLYSQVQSQPSELADKEIIFDHLSKDLGLSQRSINCMLQDHEGYLWLGTWSGLVMYDGYSTTVFQSGNASEFKLKSNKITALYETPDHMIWIGTLIGGLYSYDKKTGKFHNYSHDPVRNSISDNNIWSITADAKGMIWIGTQNGLNRYDRSTDTFQVFYHQPDKPSSLCFNFVTSLHASIDNSLWVGTERGVSRIDLNNIGGGFDHFYFSDSSTNQDLDNYIYGITGFMQDKREIICWSTKKGLKIFKEGKINNYVYEDRPSSFSFFRSIYTYKKSSNYILLGSEMGLSIFDPSANKFIRFFGDFNKRDNLSHNTVTSMLIDRGGVLWVGTKKGINKFDTYNKNFELYDTSIFDRTKGIITGIQGSTRSNAQYWLSTMGGGLYEFSPESKSISGHDPQEMFHRYSLRVNEENDFTYFIQTMYVQDNGNVWLGTAGDGVFIFNERDLKKGQTIIDNYRHYNFNGTGTNKISDNYIMSLTPDKDGGMWVGTWSGGLNKIDTNGEAIIYDQPELRKAPLVVMHQTLDGDLWIGTRGKGLIKMSTDSGNSSLEVYTHKQNQLSNDFINVIHEDQKGHLWTGTEGGLNRFDRKKKQFVNYSKNGLKNNVVVGILEDKEGRLWLSHWNGITVINPAAVDNVIVNSYDRRDRIQGGFFYNNVCYKDSKGQLIFGGSSGFNIIQPEAINLNPFAPPVIIRDFMIFNNIVEPNKEFNGHVVLNEPISEAEKVHLRFNENSISFEFAALHFSAPEKNEYAYRLIGFDKEWKYTDADRRFANYTNLKHGTYFFEVKASNGDGVWSEVPSRVELIISPPWWKTSWAFTGYIIICLLALLLFRRMIIIRTNYENNIRLERIERENLEKLNKAKLKFFTNISHEFRTPLTLILGPLEKIINSGKGGKYMRDELTVINQNAMRLLRLANQLLDFRKAESGKLKLQVAEGDIVKFIKGIKLMFDEHAKQRGVNFEFLSSSKIINTYYDRNQLEKILFNLLSNAFKHTPKGGTIRLQVIEYEKQITIIVEDTGKGIEVEKLNKIFDRFYSDNEAEGGIGIGLALVRTLVHMHRGKIEVESEVGKFTRFIVRIPLGCDHFDQSEIVKNFEDSEQLSHYNPKVIELEPDDWDHEELRKEQFQEPVNLSKKKLLLVEDNTEVRSFIKSIFNDKYIVLEAANGEQGIKLAEEEYPDVIVSDVMMPGMDGISLCAKLRENARTSHIPVILLTARTSLVNRIEGLESGADDYITKPFNAQVLKLKVRNLIDSREQLKKMFSDNRELNVEPKKVKLSSSDEKFIQMALDSVEQNMANFEYSAEDFGRDIGMSRMQVYRKLKALTGQSANEFIRTIRLKRAAQLLEQNELTIAEVTYNVGFQDLQYFRNCFKKLFGVNPSGYGKQENDSK
ncbi:response regulator [Fulvivirga sp. 29W222]|uniref:histidine kinase n=1 Tax=Fulvivirga marina TaxID=2494733 RepID=A0A937G755_9BACT|nr:two-component regulator propeller domain-containing protein [Fulvivirga marina]MBL6449666.1 response regulator [Fulvivirga marina]